MNGSDLFRSICIGVCSCYVMMAALCGVRVFRRWREGATVLRVPVGVAAGQLFAFCLVSLYATVELVIWIRTDEPIHWFRSPLLLLAYLIASGTMIYLVNFTYPGITGDDENP